MLSLYYITSNCTKMVQKYNLLAEGFYCLTLPPPIKMTCWYISFRPPADVYQYVGVAGHIRFISHTRSQAVIRKKFIFDELWADWYYFVSRGRCSVGYINFVTCACYFCLWLSCVSSEAASHFIQPPASQASTKYSTRIQAATHTGRLHKPEVLHCRWMYTVSCIKR